MSPGPDLSGLSHVGFDSAAPGVLRALGLQGTTPARGETRVSANLQNSVKQGHVWESDGISAAGRKQGNCVSFFEGG